MAASRLVGPSSRVLIPTKAVVGRRAFVSSARLLAQASPERSDPTASKPVPAVSSTASPLSPSAPPPKSHNKVTVALVRLMGRLMGYNSTTSTAIRVTSELYDKCAERADTEADFWYGECGLPRTYQTWFQITNLHVHLLLTRFRALATASKAQAYSQEMINHFFIDAESRMRMRFGVQTARLVKGYMREMHTQQRGAILGMDEAMSYSIVKDTDRDRYADADAALATAFWRNLWGAGGWGEGVGGVKRKLKGIDRLSEEEKAAQAKTGKKVDDDEVGGMPELAQDVGMAATGRGNAAALDAQTQASQTVSTQGTTDDIRLPTDSLKFALVLQRLVKWYRLETVRLANISNEDVERGRVGGAAAVRGQTMEERLHHLREAHSVANFSRI